MQNKTFYTFLSKIIELKKVNSSAIPQSIKNSGDFRTLLDAGFIRYHKSITGGGSYIVENDSSLQEYFLSKFPKKLRENFSADANLGTFRNTKVGKRISQNVALIRGFCKIEINTHLIDLKKYTTQFGTFSARIDSVKTERICVVENLDSYLQAEKIIGKKTVFIHSYGGLSKSLINKLEVEELLIFVDYDYVGLKNFLTVKKIFPNAELFVPDNYDYLFKKYSRSIKTKNGNEQMPHESVVKSNHPLVRKIREDIYSNKQFLEQQALFQDD